ncbi:MAG: PASTA domain-containing protein [Oscillospiraceae bacterium]|nr:PASTA domain-containing protein [Oscillospiraceae bacterium]
MSDIKRRCIGCMREIEDVQVCPYCGYDEKTPVSRDYLSPRTLLHDRYLTGRPLRYNGEGVTYIGYDLVVDGVVEVREYFPDQLSAREKDSADLVILPGFEAQFKALMVDFVELNESLIKMRTLTSIEQTYEVFEENNTAYAVKEHVQGITFAQFLTENAGELDWDKTFALFEPLLKNISAMHAYNILHRGISPDTIRVTKRHELKLCDFCIGSVRNVKTEISPQIFMGYAAPEQFSSSIFQGTWTDVYAVCALLYRTLTGSRPPEISNRGYMENVIPPSILNSTVPSAVSDAILKGLSQITENRTKTVGVLLSDLSSAKSEFQIQVEEQEPPQQPKKKRYGLLALLITSGILVVVGIVVVIFALSGTGGAPSMDDSSSDSSLSSSDFSGDSSSSSLSSEPNSSSASGSTLSGPVYAMPKLVDQIYESVKNNESYVGMIVVEAEHLYNEEVEKGIIYEQSIEPDSPISADTVVKVKVSKGSQYPTIPEFSGYKKDSYVMLLEELGIFCELESEESEEVARGYIISVSPQPGSVIDLEKDTKVKVVVSQ